MCSPKTDIRGLLAVLLLVLTLFGFNPTPAAAAWSPTPSPIDTGTNLDASSPQIAINSLGQALAVWVQTDGSYYRLYANRWNGSAWSGAALIDAGTGQNVSTPRIALDASGSAIVVWVQRDGTGKRVYANRWNGSFWAGAEIIDAGLPGSGIVIALDVGPPVIALDGSGNAIAVWSQWSGSDWRNYARRWNGSSWSGAADISGYAFAGVYSQPQVAFDATGNAIAVWNRWDGTNYRVSSNHWNGSVWSGATVLDAGPGFDAWGPQVAIDGSGHAIAVWSQLDGVNLRVGTRRWDGSAWSGMATLDAGGSDTSAPQIALDGSGNAISIWGLQSSGTSYRTYANRWNGVAWGGPEAIDDGVGGNIYPRAQIALDGAGNATAVWDQSDGAITRIYANRWNGSAWSGAALIDGGNNYFAANPTITRHSTGTEIALYVQYDNQDNGHIYANLWTNSIAVPSAIPALTGWGMILLCGLIVLFGLSSARREKSV